MLDKPLAQSATDYVLLSDIHLGADLVEHVRPWSRESWLSEKPEIDARLSAMIAHHVAHAERHIQFVINGDFVDFIGMSLPPPEHASLRTGLTREEAAHGLGNTADRSAWKMRAVARRHATVFRALADAVCAGHRLAIVHGNHDTEWHWHPARKAFVDALALHWPEESAATLRQRISFHPWFFYVPGLLYVEHGHEYDPMCGYGDPLVPVCPRNPKRIRDTPSAVLLRCVARPTRGLSTFGHEQANFLTYMRMAASFGVVGALCLFKRFALASLRLLVDTQSFGIDKRAARTSALRLSTLAKKHGLSRETLVQLRSLHVRPVAGSFHRLIRSLYWDRLGLCAFVVLAWTVLLVSAPYAEALRWSLSCTALAAVFGVATGLGRDIDPAPRMREAARFIAQRLGVRFVVMGHTHEPRFDALDDDARYVNLGHWGQDELPEDRDPNHAVPVSSYLHLTATLEGHRGVLCAFSQEHGPRELVLHEAPASGRVTPHHHQDLTFAPE